MSIYKACNVCGETGRNDRPCSNCGACNIGKKAINRQFRVFGRAKGIMRRFETIQLPVKDVSRDLTPRLVK